MIEKDLKELAISAKLHQYQGHIVLAICDEELLGKTLNNNGVPFRISKFFYGGPVMDEDSLVKLILQVGNINVLGKRSVLLLRSLGLVKGDEISIIDGIEHVQIYKIVQ